MKAQALNSISYSSPRYELTQLEQAEDAYEKGSMLDDDFFNEVRICNEMRLNLFFQ